MEKTKGSVRIDAPNILYYSHRGIPLVTQRHDEDWDSDGNEIRLPFLTVENHNKWYGVYIVDADGNVEKTFWGTEDNKDMIPGYKGLNEWNDHAISPAYFHAIAEHRNLTYDSASFAMVVEMYLNDALDGDATKLHHHLPK